MRILVRDALLVTMNERDEIVEGGAAAIEGRRFSYVGPAAGAPPGPFDLVIDGRSRIALPGLVNAHCHSPANLCRGLFASRPLEIWRAYYRAALRGMGEEDFYASALLGGMEMLKTGTTTVLDHFFGNQACRFTGAGAAIRAMRELGLRHVVALTLSDRRYEETVPIENLGAEEAAEVERMSASETRSARAWLDECEEFIEAFHEPEALTLCCPGPSAVQRCSDALLSGAAEIARRRGLPLHIHLAETKAQAVVGKRLYGTSLLQHLADVGAVGPNVSLAHSIWIEERDIETIARSGATAVHNPASNLRLGSGLAPIPRLLAAGAHVALGTDGAASNDAQNMFDALRLAALVHNRPGTDFRDWVTPSQALRMATAEGARALGLPAGKLAAGALADVVLLRRDTVAFTPLNDVRSQLAWCENGSSVETVIVNGEVVVREGRLARVDEREVLRIALGSRARLEPALQRELAAARALEGSLAEMYFRVFRET